MGSLNMSREVRDVIGEQPALHRTAAHAQCVKCQSFLTPQDDVNVSALVGGNSVAVYFGHAACMRSTVTQGQGELQPVDQMHMSALLLRHNGNHRPVLVGELSTPMSGQDGSGVWFDAHKRYLSQEGFASVTSLADVAPVLPGYRGNLRYRAPGQPDGNTDELLVISPDGPFYEGTIRTSPSWLAAVRAQRQCTLYMGLVGLRISDPDSVTEHRRLREAAADGTLQAIQLPLAMAGAAFFG
ncbi:hypothetical protein [Streptomyces sp. NPDC051569]|uniref:hypothetical protein n=1 Tax=Streptomyces sp. NPDC051569 TaxID=3365661 RepID=UPI0037896D28